MMTVTRILLFVRLPRLLVNLELAMHMLCLVAKQYEILMSTA